jgi:uncharacterized protein (TIGR02996 family)
MNIEAALLAEVIANPAEDGPRLICADWLEEYGGKAGQERAEFIRVQIELARLDEDDPRRAELQGRERRLMPRWEREWSWPIRHLFERLEPRRGFAERVTVSARKFVQNGETLFAVAPLREIQLVGLESAPDLPQQPALSRIEHLGIRNLIDSHPLPSLLRSHHLADLRGLDLECCDLPSGRSLFTRMPDLRSLTLTQCALTPSDFGHLAASPVMEQLLELRMHGMRLGLEEMGSFIRSARQSRLEILELDVHFRLQVRYVEQLLASGRFPRLRQLRVRGLPITELQSLSERFGSVVRL